MAYINGKKVLFSPVINVTQGGGSNDFDKYIDGTLTEFTSNVTEVRASCFWWVNSFVTVNFPEALTIGASAFWECNNLENINIPKVKTLKNSCFYTLPKLTRIDLPSIKTIESYAFSYCSNLKTIVIGTTDCVLESAAAFDGVSDFTIYVPDEAVETYKAATNWADVASQIKGISELGE